MSDVDRRAMLRRMAAFVAVAMLGPRAALARNRADGPRSAGARASATDANAARLAAPRYLAPERFALLAAVVDTTIPRTDTPGALDAGVHASFDAMLRDWAAPATRVALLATLDDIDAAARASHGAPFVALDEAGRVDVLDAYDRAQPEVGRYAKFKQLIVGLYYTSEPGATQELRYEHVPGAWEPSLRLMRGERQWATPSQF